MEIKIPNIGKRDGTCGWLATGLASGTIKIETGKCKAPKSNPGLWLKFDGREQVLALFNPFDLTNAECEGSERCLTSDQADFILTRNHSFTSACWASLMDIAQNWCDEQNATFENDDPSPLKSLTVSVA